MRNSRKIWWYLTAKQRQLSLCDSRRQQSQQQQQCGGRRYYSKQEVYSASKQLALCGQVALVFGACSAVGQECVREFLMHGIKGVMLADSSEDAGRRTLKCLNSTFDSDKFAFIRTDCKSPLLRNAFRNTIKTFGGLNIVVNNVQFDGRNWDDQINKNIKSTVGINLLAMETMGRHNCGKGGTMVNIVHPFDDRSQLYPINAAINEFIGCFNSITASIYYDCTCVKIVTLSPQNMPPDCFEERIGKELREVILNTPTKSNRGSNREAISV